MKQGSEYTNDDLVEDNTCRQAKQCTNDVV